MRTALSTPARTSLRSHAARLKRSDNRGQILMELVVAISIIAVVSFMSADILLSAFRSERSLRDRTMLIDNADLAKSWLVSKLQAADVPLPCNAGQSCTTPDLPGGAPGNTWKSLEFTADGVCYILALDLTTGQLNSQQGADCTQAQTSASTVVAQWVTNTDPNTTPLFTYWKNDPSTGAATQLTVDNTTNSQIAQATEIIVNLDTDRPNDFAKPYQRVMTFNLGGAFVSGDLPDNSVSTSKLANGAVTATKIADGAIGNANIAPGAIDSSKLTTNARTTYFSIPVVSGQAATITMSGSWASAASGTFRAGATLSDYCANYKTLQVRALFTVHNTGGGGVTPTLRLQQENSSGSSTGSLTSQLTTSSGAVGANSYATFASSWYTVIASGNCTGLSSDATGTYYYEPQANGASGSIDIVNAVLQLRYQ